MSTKTFEVAIKTYITNRNIPHGVHYFLMHAESAEQIRDTLGNDIDVAKFLTWFGAVDLVTGKLIDDGRELPKRLGEATEMRLLNINECEGAAVPCSLFHDIKDIKDYDDMCRKYDFDLDEIYDIDWVDAIC